MSNPFAGRKLAARAAAPQFPQRRAKLYADGGKTSVFRADDPKFDPGVFDKRGSGTIRVTPRGDEVDAGDVKAYDKMRDNRLKDERDHDENRVYPPDRYRGRDFRFRRGGRVPRKLPGFLFGGLFGGDSGSGGSSSTYQTTGSNSNTSSTSQGYNDLMNSVFGRAAGLLNNPVPVYNGSPVAPLTYDQTTAMGNIRANQGNWSPFFNQANQTLGQVSGGYNPNAGENYVQQAGSMPTGTQAASPFLSAAAQTAPGNIGAYMSPYTSAVTDRIAELGNRNLTENILPAVNDTFTGGDAAQFGRERHADITGRAIRDTQDSILGAQANALEQGYNEAGNLFTSDANRAAGLAGTAGTIANQDTATKAGVGQTAANVQGANTNSGLAIANGQTGLGQATQQAGLTDAQALLTSGNQQQQQNQNENNWNYNVWQNAQQYPYQQLQFAQGIANGWQGLPMTTTSNSTSYGQSSMTQPQGSPFGQIAGLGLAGASLLGSGGLSGLFGAGAGMTAANPAATMSSYSMYPGAYTNPGFPVTAAQGGMIPTVAQMRKRSGMKGTQPTGMPGMPPMAPPNPQMKQPNGQMYARGGSVAHPFPHMPRKGVPGNPFYSADDFADGGEVPGYGIGGDVGSVLGKLAGAYFGGPFGAMLGGMGGKELGSLLPFAEGGSVFSQGAISDEERAMLSQGKFPSRLYSQGALSDRDREILSNASPVRRARGGVV
jgi:hypothetical protein